MSHTGTPAWGNWLFDVGSFDVYGELYDFMTPIDHANVCTFSILRHVREYADN